MPCHLLYSFPYSHMSLKDLIDSKVNIQAFLDLFCSYENWHERADFVLDFCVCVCVCMASL